MKYGPAKDTFGDGVGGEDHLDLAALDQRLALRGRGLHELDLVALETELLGDVLGHLDVEAGVVGALLQTEAGLVVLDADGDRVRAGRAAGSAVTPTG
jgi:hypothetical protein